MVSLILSLHRGLFLPLHGAHVAPEQLTCRPAASPCGRLSRPPSTISRFELPPQYVGPSLPWRLIRSYRLAPEPDGSPLFTSSPSVACWRYKPPEASRPTRGLAPDTEMQPSPSRGIGSAASITFDFAALPCGSGLSLRSLAFRPATFLSTLRSGCYQTPRKNSIRGCLAQALPRSPSQATELNALARRNPRRTGRDSSPVIRLSQPILPVPSFSHTVPLGDRSGIAECACAFAPP